MSITVFSIHIHFKLLHSVFHRAPSVFSILLLLLRDSYNFKIRIQAAAALAAPPTILGESASLVSVIYENLTLFSSFFHLCFLQIMESHTQMLFKVSSTHQRILVQTRCLLLQVSNIGLHLRSRFILFIFYIISFQHFIHNAIYNGFFWFKLIVNSLFRLFDS